MKGALPFRVFYIAFVQGALPFRVFYVAFVQGALPVRVFYVSKRVTGPDDTVYKYVASGIGCLCFCVLFVFKGRRMVRINVCVYVLYVHSPGLRNHSASAH